MEAGPTDPLTSDKSLRAKVLAMENILKLEGQFRDKNPYAKIRARMDSGKKLTGEMRVLLEQLNNVEFLALWK